MTSWLEATIGDMLARVPQEPPASAATIPPPAVFVTEDGITLTWVGVAVMDIGPDGVGYAIFDGATYRPGSHVMHDADAFAAGVAEISAAIKAALAKT